MAEFDRGRSHARRPGGMRHGGNQGARGGGGDKRGGGGGHTSGGHGGASPRAAVPWYAGADFQEAPPGHRYLLYLPFWKEDWNTIKEGKQKELAKVGAVPRYAAETMRALAERQRDVGRAARAEVVEAISISPFATGLGWEHPNENGFAFLHPYGLPYLPGSGVKGVLRDAAQQLADGCDGDTRGWTSTAVQILFGPVPEEIRKPDDASCGALRFFDVIPEIAVDDKGKVRMGVDIMNPHHSAYYQDNATPHDAGSPVPIFFLVVPPGSRFIFAVDCPREHTLPGALAGAWRVLIREALDYAFDWLGFGAKTAVGYGAMKRLSDEEIRKVQQEMAAASLKCAWVDDTIRALASKNNIPENKFDEVLRGRALAKAWAELTDSDLRKRALEDIRFRWQERGWWESPPGGAARQAKEIYESTA